jgi:endoglucanase
MIDLKISYMMKAGNKIHVTYTGNQIAAIDGTILENFYNKKVNNTLIPRHQIPGRIQAEDYYHNEGLAAETCTDTGGGSDMGWTDNGDYLDYLITVSSAGNYAVNYRIASLNTAGQIEMQLINENVVSLHTIDLPITGGWQTWTTATKNVELPAGIYKLRLHIKKGGFNINWFKFDFVSATKPELFKVNSLKIFPNPASDRIFLKSDLSSELEYELINLTGQILLSGKIVNLGGKPDEINVSGIPHGIYLIRIISESGIFSQKIIID